MQMSIMTSKHKGALTVQSKNDASFLGSNSEKENWALNGKTAIRKPIPEEPLLLASALNY